MGKESLYRTYSDNVAYKVPYTSEFQIYIVVDYDINSNLATCIQMNYHDIIPANTGIIVHSNVEGTVFLEYVKDDDHLAYDNEKYPNNLYQYSDEKSYTNYLKPINGSLHIDNVEIVDGVKTYRNYFFNKGTTAALRPGPDWKPEYITEGWGFFRAVSKDYRVFNKAFLHLPASMTDSNSEYIKDNRVLPQDNTQSENNSKNTWRFQRFFVSLQRLQIGSLKNSEEQRIIAHSHGWFFLCPEVKRYGDCHLRRLNYARSK